MKMAIKMKFCHFDFSICAANSDIWNELQYPRWGMLHTAAEGKPADKVTEWLLPDWTTRRSATSSAFRTDRHSSTGASSSSGINHSSVVHMSAVALVSGADERLAARDLAASVARLVTAQYALSRLLAACMTGVSAPGESPTPRVRALAPADARSK